MASVEYQSLRLAPGAGMKLEIAGDDKRYSCQLIGHIQGRSVLVSTPMVGDGRALLVRKEQSVIVRFFANTVACAFKSRVQHLCSIPMPYLHLSWPGRVEAGEVRKAERVLANLQVTVVNKSQVTRDRAFGAIVDLSTTGARLETIQPCGAVGDSVLMTGRVTVGHVSRVVTIEAQIRAELEKLELRNSMAAYGIEFKFVSDIDFLALQAYVNAQIARGSDR